MLRSIVGAELCGMLLTILFTAWIITLVNGDQCQLYNTYVKFSRQCETLCDYISSCESFSYSPDTHQCQIWRSPGPDKETRKHAGKDPHHACLARPCDVTDICVPVKTTTEYICLQYNSICSCGAPDSQIGHASLVTAPVIPTDYALAVYTCKDGFVRVSGSNTTTCQSANWSQLSLVCQEITCNSTPWVIPNATHGTVTSNKHGATITYTCLEGHRSHAGNTTSYCQETGEWSTPTLQCEEINCSLPIWIIPNTTSTSVLSSQYGATVTYSCDVGYTYIAGNDTSHCQQNAEWSKPTITCQVTQCTENPPAIQNTTMNMTSSNYADIVTYSCVDGYKYTSGENTSVCQASGTWSVATIVCTEITCNSTPWIIPNATHGTVTSKRYGATITYTCLEGHRSLAGNTTSYCQETGEWSTPTLQCEEINCSLPIWIIPNTTSTSVLSTQYGATVTYSCDVGYTYIAGNDTSHCQQNAEWSKPTITCQVIQCLGNAISIQNTTMNMTSSNYADIVTYSCVDGYKYISGENTSVCQASGTWSVATIVCTEWEEWGWKILGLSTEYISEPGYSATEILGEFDVYPRYGDLEGAWAPLKKNCPSGKEWIQVQFAESLYIHRVDIYETHVAGVVKNVSVGKDDGTWSSIWTASSVSVITQSRIFSPEFTTPSFSSDRVMLETDCSGSSTWVEFDAIKIFGLKSPPQIPG
ncbi:complement component receptor 1-like protein [Haliotis asinina]|uniref:complement component receptor 1-like protein n=1 Tax=Haliotis asinina TaxID=109174 RepID=UPI003531CC84